jgi:uncharacterized protein YbjT (DUF2867 family)
VTTSQPVSPRGDTPTIAVVGATGQQGGATAEALIEAGVAVRAVVRDGSSQDAKELRERGAQLVTADLDQSATLVTAFEGADAVFAMTTFTGPRGTEGEVANGTAIGDAARAAGVSRIVYSSVGGAERHTGIPHFESKRRVEEHLDGLGLRTTFVRPAFFMENFAAFFRPSVEDGQLVVRLPLPAGVPLQMVATRDIGRVAAAALLDPDRVPGGAVEIAGDELTGEQVAEVYSQADGRDARYEPLPLEALNGDPDQQSMFTWLTRRPAYQADFQLTRDLDPQVWDLAAWLANTR